MENNDIKSNSSLTIANVLDEIDLTIGQYIKPTTHFLQTFNIFVEGIILTDDITITMTDFQHILLSQPFFINGRPILNFLIKEKLLNAIIESHKHMENSIGEVLYVFSLDDNKTLETDKEWFNNYKNNIDKSNFDKIFNINYNNSQPDTTPLLMISGKDNEKVVALMNREIEKCLLSVFSLTQGSKLNPLLPYFASKTQIDFYNNFNLSYDYFNIISKQYNENIENVIKHLGYQYFPIPPLVSLLFTRCKTINDIPEKIIELRDEFKDLRLMAHKYIDEIEKSNNLKEQFNIIDEYREFCFLISSKYDKKSSRILYRFLDIIEDGNPISMVTKSIKVITECLENKRIQYKFKGLTNLWNIYDDIPSIQNQLSDVNRLFGDSINQISMKTFSSSIPDTFKNINHNL